MIKVDCKAIADEILDKVASVPHKKALAIISVGENAASESYMRGKKKDCERCGIPCIHFRVNENDPEDRLIDCIQAFNENDDVGGIILQLPLPDKFKADTDSFVNMISSSKDVDGFKSDSRFSPCTPEGIIHIMKHEISNNLTGMSVVLIGRGKLVGKPLIDMLLEENCTLTICHSHTYETDLERNLQTPHDAVICAANTPELIDAYFVNAYLAIDACIGKVNGHLRGNLYNIENGWDCTKYTSVPGGVGLLTRAMLMKHMYEVEYGPLELEVK